MASKVFLDANILLDLTLKRADYDVAKKVMQLAIDGRIQVYVTPSIIHFVSYWLAKAYDQTKAKEIIIALLNDVACIEISHEQVISALHSTIKDVEQNRLFSK
jgi:predicted nucleic acid-binding protein